MPRKKRATKRKPRAKKTIGLVKRITSRRDRLFLAAILAAVGGNIIVRRQWSEALRSAPMEVVTHMKNNMDAQSAENAIWLFGAQAAMILMGNC